jgi:hypothetical protein
MTPGQGGGVSGSKNLILGVCARCSFAQLTPFVASLRNTPFAGDICLLIEDIAAETVDRLRCLGVIVERAAPSAQQRMSAAASRYFSYLDHLIRRGDGYANVMLVDPATSVFQGDPFAAPLPADIVYTGERRAIGATPAVHDAVVQAYGEAVARNIRDCMVADASTILGTLPGVRRYLVSMTHQLAGRTTLVTGVIEQGVHNYVVHMRPLSGAWLDPSSRIVAAVPTLPEGALAITDQGVLVDGHAVPVLARWDGSPSVAQHVTTAPRYRLADTAPPGCSTGPSARRGGRLLPAPARRRVAGAVPRQPPLRR